MHMRFEVPCSYELNIIIIIIHQAVYEQSISESVHFYIHVPSSMAVYALSQISSVS